MNPDQAHALQKMQESWLFACLKRNAETLYGRRYDFNRIDSLKSYQKQVPIIDYETIEPLIKRIAAGEADLLFAGIPVAFEVTGGSGGGGKLIPYTPHSFDDFQRALLPWFGDIAQYYGVTGEAAYWSISPALRHTSLTQSGIKIGVSDAAYLGEEAGAALSSSVVVPAWVGELNDVRQWQLATLYWLIRCPQLELVSVWSPTFLLMLLEMLEECSDELLALLHQGGDIESHSIAADAEAHARFIYYLQDKQTALLWPRIKLISCWQDASSKPFFEQLHYRFPQAEFQPKGLICTEGVVTMPNPGGKPLLAVSSGFYEFLDTDQNALLAHELVVGHLYEVLMTTGGGLYRYRTGDLVEYEGSENALPSLRFIGRSGIVSDMVGEKLNEAFVSSALKEIEGFAMLVPQSSATPHYLLLGDSPSIRQRAAAVQEKLLQNPQYAYACKIGQLGALETVVLSDTMRLYIDYKVSTGSRIGDIKLPALQCDDAWLKVIRRNMA